MVAIVHHFCGRKLSERLTSLVALVKCLESMIGVLIYATSTKGSLFAMKKIQREWRWGGERGWGEGTKRGIRTAKTY